MSTRAGTGLFVGLAALCVLAALSSLALGSAQEPTLAIVMQIRLPRTILAGLVGAGLATAGALLQALLQNPLADPYVLGISGGAALGGVIALALGTVLGPAAFSVPAVAFGGALLATALLYAVAGAGGRAPAHSLLLTGVVFNAFASSLIVFVTTASDLSRVASVFLWLIGSIRLEDASLIATVALLLGIGLGVGMYHAYALNLLSQGDETAAHLGVDVRRTRRHILLATALMIGASVAVSGLIGFVGLIVPHLLRLLLGSDNRVIVPASALLGAAFLMLTDAIARTVIAPTEVPVGAITALFGGPLFLILLRRELSRRIGMSALLHATGVAHAYAQTQVLNGVDFELASGRLVIVVGPNGSGKTTLVRILAGILRPNAGSVAIGGVAVDKLARRQIAQRLAVVPQESFVPFPYTVDEMVSMGRAPSLGALGREGPADRERVGRALEELALVELAERDYSTLSGGEKQRVLLARARAQDTDAMLLDEPTAHMDLGHRMHCFEWLRGWVGASPERRGAGVITHDLLLAARFADTLVLLDGGRVVATGEPDAVLTPERIADVYGVDARVDRDPEGRLSVTPIGTRETTEPSA